jgi:two-component system sensor histidine kinase KdpD
VTDAHRSKRGLLRVYLGAAPGVGKTFAMLDEGWRRKERGPTSSSASSRPTARPRTQEQVRDLEVVPRQHMEYRGRCSRRWTSTPSSSAAPRGARRRAGPHERARQSPREKRWEDVEELLAAGIDVITTVNIQHLESLNDVIEQITGIRQRETVPDAVVRRADQIELVDMSPEALRRRMAHGNIYPAERVDAALANYFRPGTWPRSGSSPSCGSPTGSRRTSSATWRPTRSPQPWETRERVVVAVTGAPGGIRWSAGPLASPGASRGGLVGVHVVASDGLETRAADRTSRKQRQLLGELGGDLPGDRG